MSPQTRLSLVSCFLGQLQDRFSKYHEPKDIGSKLDQLSQIDGIDGVELIYPVDFADVDLLKESLHRNNLHVSAVNLNLKSESQWLLGSLTVPDKKVRQNAVQQIRNAMDSAAEVKASRVTIAFLNDGHDYSFEVDYGKAWKWLVEGFQEGARHRSDIILNVEYKPNEPRVRTIVGNVSKSILLCRDTGLDNVGVTLDFGHALYAGENPSESLSLLYHYELNTYIHLNDCYRNWDWDLLPGTVNFWDFVEFFYYAKEFGYDDWMTFDVFPSRFDVVKGFKLAVEQIKKIVNMVDRIDVPAIRNSIREGTIEVAWDSIFKLI